MKNTQIESARLWKLIDDAQSEVDHQTANAIFSEAERLARDLHQLEPHNAEHCYAMALTYYHRRDEPNERSNCIEWLHKTSDLDPSHPWVPLFLGYQFFDEQRYGEAFIHFDRVDQSYFSFIDQQWRNIKTDELMLVCLIHFQTTPVDTRLLVRLADRYADAPIANRPMPTEIIKTLANPANRTRFTVSATHVAHEAARLARVCSVAFPHELAAFETAARDAE